MPVVGELTGGVKGGLTVALRDGGAHTLVLLPTVHRVLRTYQILEKRSKFLTFLEVYQYLLA